MTYAEKLRDPRWQRKRLEALDNAGWRCSGCRDKTSTLYVHHNFYVRGREPWEYSVEELTVACDPCHSRFDALRAELTEWLALVEPFAMEELLGFVKALACRSVNEYQAVAFHSLEEAKAFVLGSRAAVALRDVAELLHEHCDTLSLARLNRTFERSFLAFGESVYRPDEEAP